jgi:hypothetical protein
MVRCEAHLVVQRAVGQEQSADTLQRGLDIRILLTRILILLAFALVHGRPIRPEPRAPAKRDLAHGHELRVPRLAPAEQRPGGARGARARGAAAPVRERARVRRRVDLDDRVDRGQVEPTRGDVRREQHVHAAAPAAGGEGGKRARARRGLQVPVQRVQGRVGEQSREHLGPR